VLHPFYIFQIFSIVVWLFDKYYVFAACIAIISTISAITTLIETRRNLVQLREMAIFKCDVTRLVTVNNKREAQVVSSVDLVPGDVIEIPNNFVLPCDVALLSGQCIVNEAMLTGGILGKKYLIEE
jgi:cation-transporting ATPase 13A2